MEPRLLENSQFIATLQYVADNPGKTAYVITGGKNHNKTREARLADLMDAGLISGAESVGGRGTVCVQYSVTERGRMLLRILELIKDL